MMSVQDRVAQQGEVPAYDVASTAHPFMYHCHMSNHEDEGLMGQFLVVP